MRPTRCSCARRTSPTTSDRPSARPYLDLAVLERALLDTGADAAWPGWGFVAEDPAFVDLCDKLGVTFIGPSAEAMRRLGDKIGSKLIAEEVGVPVAPWSRGAVDSLEDALAAAEEVGYPLMLKATAGGGGRGIRMVASPADLEDAYQRTSDEALRAFGNGTVFLERLVTGARHVEVQLIADGHGTAWAVGVRDCSIQRRNQKVIEESSSPLLSDEQNEELKASAERLALAVGYVGAGTVEFLYHPGEKTFAFLEVNTRLQVEHSITEVTTDIDLVKAQIHVAQGGRLEGEKPAEVGHAVEARLNAEDPDRDFAPSPGRIVHLDLPAGPGHPGRHRGRRGRHHPARLRLDDRQDHRLRPHPRGGSGPAAPGDDLDDRGDRGRRVQQELRAGPAGPARGRGRAPAAGPTPAGSTASAPRVGSSRMRTPASRWSLPPSRPTSTGLRIETARLLETAHGGRPSASHQVGMPVELKLRGVPYQVSTINTGPGRFRVSVASGATSQTVDVADGAHRRRTPPPGRRWPAYTSSPPPTGRPRSSRSTASPTGSAATRAACCARPHRRSSWPPPSSVGAEVEAGAAVVVLESMKMETVVHAPFAARVKELSVITGSQVETGTALIKLEQVGRGRRGGGVGRRSALDLPPPTRQSTPRPVGARARAALTAVVLGYDVPPEDQDAALSEYLAVRDELRAAGEPVVADELSLLEIFADLAELTRNRPVDEDRQHRAAGAQLA